MGTDLVDDADDRWLVREVAGEWITLQHPERGVHRVRRGDLVAWVDAGRWKVVG